MPYVLTGVRRLPINEMPVAWVWYGVPLDSTLISPLKLGSPWEKAKHWKDLRSIAGTTMRLAEWFLTELFCSRLSNDRGKSLKMLWCSVSSYASGYDVHHVLFVDAID